MRQRMRLIVLGLLGIAFAMTMTACATTGTTGTIGDRVACEAFGTISFSAADDSAETVRQVREHNAAWRAVCEPGK